MPSIQSQRPPNPIQRRTEDLPPPFDFPIFPRLSLERRAELLKRPRDLAARLEKVDRRPNFRRVDIFVRASSLQQ